MGQLLTNLFENEKFREVPQEPVGILGGNVIISEDGEYAIINMEGKKREYKIDRVKLRNSRDFSERIRNSRDLSDLVKTLEDLQVFNEKKEISDRNDFKDDLKLDKKKQVQDFYKKTVSNNESDPLILCNSVKSVEIMQIMQKESILKTNNDTSNSSSNANNLNNHLSSLKPKLFPISDDPNNNLIREKIEENLNDESLAATKLLYDEVLSEFFREYNTQNNKYKKNKIAEGTYNSCVRTSVLQNVEEEKALASRDKTNNERSVFKSERFNLKAESEPLENVLETKLVEVDCDVLNEKIEGKCSSSQCFHLETGSKCLENYQHNIRNEVVKCDRIEKKMASVNTINNPDFGNERERSLEGNLCEIFSHDKTGVNFSERINCSDENSGCFENLFRYPRERITGIRKSHSMELQNNQAIKGISNYYLKMNRSASDSLIYFLKASELRSNFDPNFDLNEESKVVDQMPPSNNSHPQKIQDTTSFENFDFVNKLDLPNKNEAAPEKDGPIKLICKKESIEDKTFATAERKTAGHFTNKIAFNDNICPNNESESTPLFRNTELPELEMDVFNKETKSKMSIEGENLTSCEKYSSPEVNESLDMRSLDLHISCEEQSSFERITILENAKQAAEIISNKFIETDVVEIISNEFIETDVVEIISNEFIETGVVEISSNEFMAANVVEKSSDVFTETFSLVETNSVEFVTADSVEINFDIFTATDFVKTSSHIFTANIGEPTLPLIAFVERPDIIVETNVFNEEIEKHSVIEPFLECTAATTLDVYALKLPVDYPLNAPEESGELAFRKNESNFHDVTQTDFLDVVHNSQLITIDLDEEDISDCLDVLEHSSRSEIKFAELVKIENSDDSLESSPEAIQSSPKTPADRLNLEHSDGSVSLLSSNDQTFCEKVSRDNSSHETPSSFDPTNVDRSIEKRFSWKVEDKFSDFQRGEKITTNNKNLLNFELETNNHNKNNNVTQSKLSEEKIFEQPLLQSINFVIDSLTTNVNPSNFNNSIIPISSKQVSHQITPDSLQKVPSVLSSAVPPVVTSVVPPVVTSVVPPVVTSVAPSVVTPVVSSIVSSIVPSVEASAQSLSQIEFVSGGSNVLKNEIQFSVKTDELPWFINEFSSQSKIRRDEKHDKKSKEEATKTPENNFAIIQEFEKPENELLDDNETSNNLLDKKSEVVGNSGSFKFKADYKLTRNSVNLIESIENEIEYEKQTFQEPHLDKKVKTEIAFARENLTPINCSMNLHRADQNSEVHEGMSKILVEARKKLTPIAKKANKTRRVLSEGGSNDIRQSFADSDLSSFKADPERIPGTTILRSKSLNEKRHDLETDIDDIDDEELLGALHRSAKVKPTNVTVTDIDKIIQLEQGSGDEPVFSTNCKKFVIVSKSTSPKRRLGRSASSAAKKTVPKADREIKASSIPHSRSFKAISEGKFFSVNVIIPSKNIESPTLDVDFNEKISEQGNKLRLPTSNISKDNQPENKMSLIKNKDEENKEGWLKKLENIPCSPLIEKEIKAESSKTSCENDVGSPSCNNSMKPYIERGSLIPHNKFFDESVSKRYSWDILDLKLQTDSKGKSIRNYKRDSCDIGYLFELYQKERDALMKRSQSDSISDFSEISSISDNSFVSLNSLEDPISDNVSKVTKQLLETQSFKAILRIKDAQLKQKSTTEVPEPIIKSRPFSSYPEFTPEVNGFNGSDMNSFVLEQAASAVRNRRRGNTKSIPNLVKIPDTEITSTFENRNETFKSQFKQPQQFQEDCKTHNEPISKTLNEPINMRYDPLLTSNMLECFSATDFTSDNNPFKESKNHSIKRSHLSPSNEKGHADDQFIKKSLNRLNSQTTSDRAACEIRNTPNVIPQKIDNAAKSSVDDPDSSGAESFITEDVLIKSNIDSERTVICGNPPCSKFQVLQGQQKSKFKTCQSCFTCYCSNRCKRTHWEVHKRTCLYGRICKYIKSFLKQCEKGKKMNNYFSKLSAENYKINGKGCVSINFSSPSEVKFTYKKNILPTHYCYAVIKNTDDGKQNRHNCLLQQTLRDYNPEAEFVVNISVQIEIKKSQNKYHPPSVVRCGRIPFLSRGVVDYKDTLSLKRKFSLPVVNSLHMNTMETRRYFCREVSISLKRYGVTVKDYRHVYKSLCNYVENNIPFEPFIFSKQIDGKMMEFSILLSPPS